MPRTARIPDDDLAATVHKPTNGYDGERLQSFITRWKNLQAEIDRNNAAAREANLVHREDQAALVKEAAEAGFAKKQFKAVLRKLRLEERARHAADSLDQEQRSDFEMMMAALGPFAETPLGQAALDAAA